MANVTFPKEFDQVENLINNQGQMNFVQPNPIYQDPKLNIFNGNKNQYQDQIQIENNNSIKATFNNTYQTYFEMN